MESPFVTLNEKSNSTLDATIELPVLQSAARSSVDIYLPQAVSNWSGPALQENTPRIDREHFDDQLPLQGMIRAVNTTYSEQETHSQPHLIRSYARHSAKRGLAYTLLFIACLLGSATWVYLNFDFLMQTAFNGFQ